MPTNQNPHDGVFTITRTRQNNLAIYQVRTTGRLPLATVKTDLRIFRVRRVAKKLASLFARHRIEFVRVEGDVQFDVDLSAAIRQAAASTATKVFR
jgi:hypothetical protein